MRSRVDSIVSKSSSATMTPSSAPELRKESAARTSDQTAAEKAFPVFGPAAIDKDAEDPILEAACTGHLGKAVFIGRGDWHGNDLSTFEYQDAPGLRKSPIVADQNPDLAQWCVENRKAVARFEIELFLPAFRAAQQSNVGLAIASHQFSVGIDEQGSVIADAGDFLLKDGRNDPYAMFTCRRRHRLKGWPSQRLRTLKEGRISIGKGDIVKGE